MPNPLLPTQDIKNIGLSSGDPGAYTDLNQNQSRLFGLALMDLLKQYQKLGTKPFAQQEYNAREQQTNRLAYTDPGLIGASPSLQSGVRNDTASALSPTIRGAQESQQTFGEQIKGFGTTIDKAFEFLKQDSAQQDKERDDARNVIGQALTNFGSKAFDIVDPKYFKLAGYSDKARQLAKDTIKEQELQLKIEKQRATSSQDDATLSYWAGLLSTGQIGLQNVPIALRDRLVKYMGNANLNIISPTFAGKAKEKVDAFNTANNLLDIIENQAKKVITATEPLQTYGQEIKGNKYLRRFNPDFKVFNDSVNSFLTMLARAAGEKGVITDYDVERIRQGLPNLSDTITTSTDKMTKLRGLFESIKTGGVAAYTQPLGSPQSTNKPKTLKTADGKLYDLQSDGTYKLRK